MATSEELIGRQLGPYKIVEEIGKGGMAVVFKAEDTRGGPTVAIKVLSSDFTADVRALERFKREALTTKALDHPNIIKIYALGEQDGLHYFAMEYLPHQSLHDLIKKEGKLPIPRAVTIVKKTLTGLGAAHRAGVIHRDLKPENVMIDGKGEPILVDFGIAKTGKGSRLTQTGVLLGTPYYMSPEQITGKEVQVQSDLYSMGVVLYELLTANVPFQADSTFMITYKHCTEAPPPPRKFNDLIPESLQLVVLKSLEKDLRKRYQTAEEFARDLDAFEAGKVLDIQVTKARDIYAIPEFKAAMGHFNQKEYEAARAGFTQVVRDVPDPEFAAEAQRRIGESWFQEKEYVQAFRDYKLVADKWPQTEEAKRIPLLYDGCWYEHLMQGESLLVKEGRVPAHDHLASMLEALDQERVPESDRLENHWVRRLEERVEEIAEQIRRIRLLKWTAAAAGIGGTAATVFLFLYFRFVNPFAGHLVAARYEGMRGRPDGVVREYIAALNLQPGNVPTMVRLGEAFGWVNKLPEARGILDAAIKAEPRNPRALELLGDLDQAAGDPAGAKARFLASLASVREQPDVWLKLGTVQGVLGEAGDELQSYAEAIKQRPEFPEAYNAAALAQWKRRGDPAKALTLLEAAIKIREDYAPAWHNKGKVLLSQQKPDLAEKAFLEAIRFDASRADSHYQLAVIYSGKGLREKAAKGLESALRHAKEQGEPTANIHYLLGQVKEGTAAEKAGPEAADLREQAEGHYKEALRERPGEPSFAKRLGNFYWSQKAYEHAADAWDMWRKAEPGNPEPAFRSGKALMASSRTSEAIPLFEEAVRGDPRKAEYRHQLALAWLALPDPAKAGTALADTLAVDPGYVPALATLADLAVRRGDRAEALARARQILATPGVDGESRTAAARALRAGGTRPERSGKPGGARGGAPERSGPGRLGRLLVAGGRLGEGADAIDRSLALAPFQDGAGELRDLSTRARSGR